MSSPAYHHNKKTGVTYVYSVQSYWDKEKNAPRNKQVCLGRLDILGTQKMHFVLDRGFYSQTNVDELLACRHHFTLSVPSGRKWVETLIDRHHETISLPEHYIEVNDNEALYAVTHLYKWGKERRRTYLHVYYNARQAAEDFDRFTRKLLRYKQELESGQTIEGNAEVYTRVFIVTETPKRGRRVAFNDAEIQKYRKRYAGFFCILSNAVKDAMEALQIYRAKEAVGNCFDDHKNQLNMKRLRIHSVVATDSRIFLQFLALILISQIRNRDTAEIRVKITQTYNLLKRRSIFKPSPF